MTIIFWLIPAAVIFTLIIPCKSILNTITFSRFFSSSRLTFSLILGYTFTSKDSPNLLFQVSAFKTVYWKIENCPFNLYCTPHFYYRSFTHRNPTVAFLSKPCETLNRYCLKCSSLGPPCTYHQLEEGL